MVDLADDPSFREGFDDQTMKSNQSSKRGPKKLPIRWSRVIDFSSSSHQTAEVFNIQEDIDELDEESFPLPKQLKKKWKPIFNPKTFWA